MSAGKPAPRPVDKVRSIRLPATLLRRVDAYAEANTMSRSEAIRDLMQRYADGNTPEGRSRSTRRVTLWMDSVVYSRFSAKAKANKVTLASAIEAAMGEDA